MAMILDGKSLAQSIHENLKQQILQNPQKPGLAILLVGSDPASHLYVALKEKACNEIGIHFEKFVFDENIDEQILISTIHELNLRSDIHGILVQLPLPNQNADNVINAIDPKKDVDGFHKKNLESLRKYKKETPTLHDSPPKTDPPLADTTPRLHDFNIPAVALGILKLITLADQNHLSKTATIVSSDLFAEPLEILLSQLGVVSTITRPDDLDFKNKTTSADILIVALGKPKIITKEFIKPGSILIDVGTTKVDGKLFGDIDRESVESVAGALTPVPGGVGPMTVACLLENVFEAQQKQVTSLLGKEGV